MGLETPGCVAGLGIQGVEIPGVRGHEQPAVPEDWLHCCAQALEFELAGPRQAERGAEFGRHEPVVPGVAPEHGPVARLRRAPGRNEDQNQKQLRVHDDHRFQ